MITPGAVRPTIKKQRAAKKPRGLWAFGRQGAYGVWTFPSAAEFVAAIIAPPTLTAAPKPPKATE